MTHRQRGERTTHRVEIEEWLFVSGMSAGAVQDQVAAVYEVESRRVFATLVRVLGDFDLAEDALHEAFVAAMSQWPHDGIPRNPRSWLVSTGRFKAIDRIRRRGRFDAALPALAQELETVSELEVDLDDDAIEDDRLRLIFTCCHPALAMEARVGLTLREVCGLTTEEIARAFLTKPTTLAQRIVRAKNKIRDAGIPYHEPTPAEMPERLDGVLQVIYLIYNEGYLASSGDALTRADLSNEAIRLTRLLAELLPEPEVHGLLALMLLQESRRAARSTAEGDLIVLEDQDRSLWDQEQIAEGRRLVDMALISRRFGPYTIQAAIAAVHADAQTPAETNWAEIVALYDVLLAWSGSPVVELNRAVAVAMRDGPEEGVKLIDAILERGDLTGYHLAHAARADLLRRLGRADEAHEAYKRALEMVEAGPERRYLERRMEEVGGGERGCRESGETLTP